MTSTTRMAQVASKLRGRVGVIATGAALLLVIFASVGLAHDTWLLPSSLRVPVGRAITLDLTSGETFPVDDFAIAPSRIVRADVRLGGPPRPLTAPRRAHLALRYVWRPERAGIGAFAVELAPRKLTLTPDKVAEYLTEVRATPALRAAWDSIPAPKQWREQYTKHAVTFVRVGEVCSDSASTISWSAPLGLGLELVPERDPTALRAGDTLLIRVLRHGDPLPAFAVGARPAGAATAAAPVAATEGRAFRRVLAAEWRRHPRSQLGNLYTFVHHAAMGPLHAGATSMRWPELSSQARAALGRQ